MKIFGREPVAIIAGIQAVLVLMVSFGWLTGIGLKGQDDIALVVGVLSAIAAVSNAFYTNETLLAPVVALFKASIALAAIYGLNLTTEQTGLAVAAITAVFAAWQRQAVSPLNNPTFAFVAPTDTGQVVPPPGELPPSA